MVKLKKYFDNKNIDEELNKVESILKEQWELFHLEKTKEAMEIINKIKKNNNEVIKK